MKKAWAWIKKWWGALVGVALLLLGAGWAWDRRRVGKLKDELAVKTAQARLAKMEAKRAANEALAEDRTEQIERLDKRIMEEKRNIINAFEGGEKLSDKEMLRELSRMGIH